MKILFLPEIQEYYDNLEQILYEKGYFSFLDSSKKYVKELIDDIKVTISIQQHKPAPAYFDRYGKNMKYTSFRKNKNTRWYVFFTTYLEKFIWYATLPIITRLHNIFNIS